MFRRDMHAMAHLTLIPGSPTWLLVTEVEHEEGQHQEQEGPAQQAPSFLLRRGRCCPLSGHGCAAVPSPTGKTQVKRRSSGSAEAPSGISEGNPQRLDCGGRACEHMTVLKNIDGMSG